MLKKEKFIHYRTYKEKFIFKIIIYHSKAFALLIVFLTMILTLIIPLGIIRYFELDVQPALCNRILNIAIMLDYN